MIKVTELFADPIIRFTSEGIRIEEYYNFVDDCLNGEDWYYDLGEDRWFTPQKMWINAHDPQIPCELKTQLLLIS